MSYSYAFYQYFVPNGTGMLAMGGDGSEKQHFIVGGGCPLQIGANKSGGDSKSPSDCPAILSQQTANKT
ncbi:MAG TPA: hypothetical protein PLB59_05325 [Bacteroidales bacterium]|nr:hypothetical protein [Bacteroidales bacterium]HQN15541.1 hypothetical protein [Bacteroidales bacterium]HQP15366.1 hypothetical protein [Bacteroidales bacterium]